MRQGGDEVQPEPRSASDLHALADLIAAMVPSGDAVDLLEGVEALEPVKAAAAAAAVALTARFADLAGREPATAATGRRTPPRAMTVGAEVAAASAASPWAGEQRV